MHWETKNCWNSLLQYSLYYGDLEPNLQYKQGMPINCVILFLFQSFLGPSCITYFLVYKGYNCTKSIQFHWELQDELNFLSCLFQWLATALLCLSFSEEEKMSFIVECLLLCTICRVRIFKYINFFNHHNSPITYCQNFTYYGNEDLQLVNNNLPKSHF